MAHGKKYTAAAAQVDPDKVYEPVAAIDLAKVVASAAFDETVELHMKMGLDPRHADQQVRGVALLPNGLGKQVRVLVFAQGEGARNAIEAGADFVGADDIIKQVEEGWTEFDVAIATPDMMGKIGKLGRVLGRKGLMPNPKTNTVVQAQDIGRAVDEARKGRVEYRLDRTAIIHVPIGKKSFSTEALVENMATVVDSVVRAKPAGAKGQYVRSIAVSTTMGPGIKLDVTPTLALSSRN